MAPAGRVAAGRAVGGHSVTGEHGQEVEKEVTIPKRALSSSTDTCLPFPDSPSSSEVANCPK